MSSFRLLSVLLGLLVFTTGAHAEWTARGSLLVNSPEDLRIGSAEAFGSALDNGYGWGAAVGYDFPLLRLEAEGVFFQNDMGGTSSEDYSVRGDVERFVAFGNAFLDLPAVPFLDAYVGAGLGLARASLDVDGDAENGSVDSFAYSDRETAFGYQLMAGVRFDLVDPLTLSVGYRYLVLEDTNFGEGVSAISLEGGDHVWEVSLGFTF